MDVREELEAVRGIDELASIVDRVVELMNLAITGADDSPEVDEVVDRLRSLGKLGEAAELRALIDSLDERG